MCDRLKTYGLTIRLEKYLFGVHAREFLGHQITAKGTIPLPSKVKAITQFPRPENVRSLQELLGMINFYHRFVPNAATLLRPLYGALKGKSQKQPLIWTDSMMSAYGNGLQALANAALLAHPHTDSPIAITSDASDNGVGACLEQYVENCWQPLAFFSKQLREPEQKYSTYDRELLGIYLAVRHFRYLVEGRNFTVYTDHKPLVDAMHKASEPWTARQQRQLAFISEYTTNIEHVSGKLNVVADCLSRSSINKVSLGIDFVAMARAQIDSEEIQSYRTAITGLKLADMPVSNLGPVLLCDISTGTPRPIVPQEFRRQVFDLSSIGMMLYVPQKVRFLKSDIFRFEVERVTGWGCGEAVVCEERPWGEAALGGSGPGGRSGPGERSSPGGEAALGGSGPGGSSPGVEAARSALPTGRGCYIYVIYNINVLK